MQTIIYLIALYNTDKYIEATIDSVMASFQYAKDKNPDINTYLIIRNDGSTDLSKEKVKNKIKEYNNIFLFNNDKNIGLLETRRKLFIDADNLIKDKNIINHQDIYLSIVDSDDICIESRVFNQLITLSEDPTLTGCGGQVLLFQEDPTSTYNPIGILSQYKTNYDEIKVDSIFQSSALTPTMSFRYDWIKYRLDNLDRKDWWANVTMGEDWAAIVDFMGEKNFKYQHTNDVVLLYRKHEKSMTSAVTDGIDTDQAKIRKKALSYINLNLSKEEHLLLITISPCRHWNIYNIDFFQKNQKEIYQLSVKLINKIIEANRKKHFYNEVYLKKYTDEILENIQKYQNLDLSKINVLLKII